jgi:hypothetical protein
MLVSIRKTDIVSIMHRAKPQEEVEEAGHWEGVEEHHPMVAEVELLPLRTAESRHSGCQGGQVVHPEGLQEGQVVAPFPAPRRHSQSSRDSHRSPIIRCRGWVDAKGRH